MCDFITESSTLPFLEQFANSVILCSAKWYLGSHCGLWWKRKCPQIKTGKILLRNCISMCEYNSQSYTFLFSVQCANTVFWKSALGYLWMQWSLRWQRKYPQMKTGNKHCYKPLDDVWIHLTELHLCFLEQSINTVFEETEKGILASHWGLRW